jgi:hypothetical protein
VQLFCTRVWVFCYRTPKKPNFMFSKQGVEFAPGVILRQWKLFTSCRLLLTIWQQFFIFWKI